MDNSIWAIYIIGLIVLSVGLYAAYAWTKDYFDLSEKPSDEAGWKATGRIDFRMGSKAFWLQAEDSRQVDSATGLKIQEVRWRSATLQEAIAVVKKFHGD